MKEEIWSATILNIGDDALEMFEAGVVILFAHPVPPALSDVALIHKPHKKVFREINVNDEIVVGNNSYLVTDFGELAYKNLTELGHIVLYINQQDQPVLPGAVMVKGPDFKKPNVGDLIRILGV